MPTLEQSGRFQPVVLWKKYGRGAYGDYTVQAPVQIKCRVDNSSRSVNDAQGQPISVVCDLIVDNTLEIPIGSLIWLGSLYDLPDPLTGDLLVAVAIDSTPDVKGRSPLNTMSFARYNSGTLPTVVEV